MSGAGERKGPGREESARPFGMKKSEKLSGSRVTKAAAGLRIF